MPAHVKTHDGVAEDEKRCGIADKYMQTRYCRRSGGFAIAQLNGYHAR